MQPLILETIVILLTAANTAVGMSFVVWSCFDIRGK